MGDTRAAIEFPTLAMFLSLENRLKVADSTAD